MDPTRAHTYARERGVSRPLYAVARVIVVAVLRLWFRVRILGRENIPDEGPAIIAPNHKNFLDPFFVGIATRRPVRYMAKIELLDGPFGWLLLRLGAFPIRRGEADAEALETARLILTRGDVVVVFPEGTRVERSDALGSPRHGAGRLAVEVHAPIVPAAISGTSHLWRGAIPRLKRVQLAFLPPVSPEAVDPDGDPVAELIDQVVWPAVREEYGRLRATPGVIAATLAAVGVGGGLILRRRAEARRVTRVIGRVEPRRVRRRAKRKRLLRRLRL
jgi:1-acyl-sn-glycerol-3-phosphate acyltransferase